MLTAALQSNSCPLTHPWRLAQEWFFDHEKVRVISGCQGYSCTNQCGLDSEGLPCNMGSPGCKIVRFGGPASQPLSSLRRRARAQ